MELEIRQLMVDAIEYSVQHSLTETHDLKLHLEEARHDLTV